MSSSRLVSIVIPAYKPAFFEAALASALRQNHDAVEIVVCDDCKDESIKHIVDKLAVGSRWPIRYLRNPQALGEALNIARGVREARGEYIKFLYDDDLIVPDCVRLLFDVLHDSPDLKLVSAARKLINDNGEWLQDNLATRYPFSGNVVLNGPEVASFVAQHPVNFIGEPTSVMARRADLLAFGDQIMSLEGVVICGLGDMAMYLKLLRHGDLAMLARPLSYFRVSDQQSSEALRANPSVAREGHANYFRFTRELEWLRPAELNGTVRIAPLNKRNNVQIFDLRAYFDRRTAATVRNTEVATWLGKRTLSPAQHVLLHQHLQSNDGGPALAIVLSDFANNPEAVLTTLQSLASVETLLNKLKVFILADYDAEALSPLQSQLPWLAATLQDRAEVINGLMQDNEHSWWLLADAGTTFTQSGLISAVMKLIEAPNAYAVFGDEIDLHAQAGAALAWRPEFNIDYLLSWPAASSRHWLFNRQAALEVGGFDPRRADAIELDLILRLVEDDHFTEFAHSSEPLAVSALPPARDNFDEADTLRRHLQVRGYPDSQLQSTAPGQYRVVYGHAGQPLVSILLAAQDQLDSLLPCVESILENTGYPHYEILICDNHSQTPEMLQWLANIESMQSDKIRVVRQDQALSQSALYNQSAAHARGEYLLMLANDSSILHSDWLDGLLNHALRPEVGVVGAKLVSRATGDEYGGLILGLDGTATAISSRNAGSPGGYMQRMATDQNFSAVSGACMMVRQSLFADLQGLDEQLFHGHFADVDLCLKARESGHLVVWTPHVMVARNNAHPAGAPVNDEFATRALSYKWLHFLAWDPAYNKNLSLQTAQAFITQPLTELSWRPLSHRPLPVLLVQPTDRSPHGNRLANPAQAMSDRSLADSVVCHQPLALPEFARLSPDTAVFQKPLTESEARSIAAIKDHTTAFVVYDLHQYPAFAEVATTAAPFKAIQESLRSGLEQVDRVTVPTQALAELLGDIHADVRVIATRLAPEIWLGVQSRRGIGTRPRVGWVGSAGDGADLLLIANVIKALADKVEWVIMGPCPRWLRPYIHELRAPVEDSLFPGLLAGLDLDLAVVPALPHLINRTKSPTALLHHAACGYPVICSDFLDDCGLPVTPVSNDKASWIDAIEAHITDLDACARKGDESRLKVAQRWMLDTEYLQVWRDAWQIG
jgi:GT2 family glycosyltransferase